MKKCKVWVLALAVALCGAALPSAVYAAAPGTGEITVSGAGTVSVIPDVAYVSLGVNTQNENAKEAQAENNLLAAKIIDTLKAMGIAEKDIKTANFYMYPNYDYSSSGRNQITGYTVSNTVTVTIHDIDIVGDVLGEAAEAGANVSNGVQFSLLDNSNAYAQALVLAVKNAAEKAQVLANALGKTIGSPVSVSEANTSYMPVYSSAAMAADAGESARVPVQAGELSVTANVLVVYEYNR